MDAPNAAPDPTLPDRFHGLVGAWKQIATFGVIGVGAALLCFVVVFSLYTQHQEAKARTASAEKAHGAMFDLVGQMRQLTAEVRELGLQVRVDRQATAQLTLTVRALAEEVKQLKGRDGPPD